jgi:hypothetical protein
MPAISRSQLQLMAQAKADDADLLFGHGRHSNAYYLFGYSVEIGLKACIARLFVADAMPDKNLTNKIFTHKIDDLVTIAGLKPRLDSERQINLAFKGHWSVVAAWTEESRYDMVDAFTSTAMRHAVLDESNGVLRWLKINW